jgi:mannosyl-oligosaccharide glucosidase
LPIASFVLILCALTSCFLAESVSALHADTLEARSRLSSASRRTLVAAERQLNNTLLWGSYRPQNYFGFRPRLPKSVFMGLAWAEVSTFESAITNLRHQCDDRQDVMYKWTRHDGERFGKQEIRDEKANVEFTTSFVKVLPPPISSEVEVNETAAYEDTLEGGSWALRISGKAINPRRPALLSFLTYFATEDSSTELTLENEEDDEALGIPWEENIHLTGTGPGLGDFDIKIKHTSAEDLEEGAVSPASTDLHNHPVTTGAGVQDFASRLRRTQFGGALTGYDQTWRAKDTIISSFNYVLQKAMHAYQVAPPHAGMTPEQMARERSKLPAPAYIMQLPSTPIGVDHPNLIIFQDTFDLNPMKGIDGKLGSFSFDIYFESKKDKSAENLPKDAKALTLALQKEREAFDQKFQELLPMTASYVHSNAAKQGSVSDTAFARELVSSAIGGVGYFYGEQVVDRSQSAGDDEEAGEGVINIAQKEYNKAALGDKTRMEGPYELTTGTPGRSIFPRGFYW